MAARSEASESLRHRIDEHLDQEEEQSFPASDSHGDWAGPPLWLPTVAKRATATGPSADTDGPCSTRPTVLP